MYQVLKGAGLAAALFVVPPPIPAAGQEQQPGPAAVALNTLLDFRAHWVGDSTRFDACSVHHALGRPADFPAGLLPSVLPLLDRTSQPCAEDARRTRVQRPASYVRVDSIAVSGDSTARVHIAVRKQSEQRYFETYDLGGLNRGLPLGWVREVRVWGISRVYAVPPGRNPPNSPEQ